MASYKKDAKVTELAKAFQAQKEKEASAVEERKQLLEECKTEMYDFIIWLEKEKGNLEIG